MNPSAQGWVNKLTQQSPSFFAKHTFAEKEFYTKLNAIGFTYGTNVGCFFSALEKQFDYTQEELAKLNLLLALLWVHHQKEQASDAVEDIIQFYNELNEYPQDGFSRLLQSKNKHLQLEKIIHQRVQPKGNVLQKNFSRLITNAMLFLDVIYFQHWIENPGQIHVYARQTEGVLMNLIYLAIQEKATLGKHDQLLIQLLETSLRFEKHNQNEMLSFQEIDFRLFSTYILKRYAIDLICMTIYSDQVVEANESAFVFRLAEKMQLDKLEVEDALLLLQDFVFQHKSKILYFNYKNPILHFYNRTQRQTQVLLKRNKKRLVQEISESKELMHLLKVSTFRKLDDVEKQKVKDQLLDIFKSIPSLAIFALPGGGILLPIIIRFIPQLLPSSFNENNQD